MSVDFSQGLNFSISLVQRPELFLILLLYRIVAGRVVSISGHWIKGFSLMFLNLIRNKDEVSVPSVVGWVSLSLPPPLNIKQI